MKPRSFRLCSARFAIRLMLAALAAGAVRAGENADGVKRYRDDVRMLGIKVGQHRFRLTSTSEGQDRLAGLELQLTRLKSAVEQMESVAGEVDTKDSRVHYLTEMEIGPKQRELDRISQAHQQRYEQLTRQEQAVDREWAWWATQKHNFTTPEEQAGLDAAWVQYNRIKALDDRYRSDLAKARREMREEYDRAQAACTKAQEELEDTETKRQRFALQLQEAGARYHDARAPLVEQLVALDSAPAPVNIPLTPFASGVPASEAGLILRVTPPVGPGLNTRALDQLRVVTASSRDAAGRDEHDQGIGEPAQVTASTEAGYQFDTGGGTGVAPLPGVNPPPAAPAVPLVVPVSPVVRDDAPTPVKNSPKLQQLASRQVENVRKLDDLYAARRALLQRGADATPAEWTKVVADISTTHAAITRDVVAEKLAEGSGTIDLTIVPKSQRKRTADIVVPPPELPPPAPPK